MTYKNYYSSVPLKEREEMTEDAASVFDDFDDLRPTKSSTAFDLMDSLSYPSQESKNYANSDELAEEEKKYQDKVHAELDAEQFYLWQKQLHEYILEIADDDNISPFALPLPKKIPKIVEVSNSILPQQYRAANVLALLPILGMLATGERHRPLEGGNRLDSISLNTCIVGDFASGKGFIEQTKEPLLRATINEDREKCRRENANRRLARRGLIADDYQCDVRIAPTDVSKKALYSQMAANNGKHVLINGAEVDELVKGQQATWSYLRAINKLAFDNTDGGSMHSTTDSNFGAFPIFLNMLVEGTYYPVVQFFGTTSEQINDGMPSRWCFALLPQADPYGDRPTYGHYTDKQVDFLQSVADRLSHINGEYNCEYVTEAVIQWEKTRKEWARSQDMPVIAKLCRRAAIIGQRAGQVYACCENIHDVNYDLCSTDEKFNVKRKQMIVATMAAYVAEITLRSQYYLFGNKFMSYSHNPDCIAKKKQYHDAVRALLPISFNKEQFMAAYKKCYPDSKSVFNDIQYILSKWCNPTYAFCKKINADTWEKIVPEEIKATSQNEEDANMVI